MSEVLYALSIKQPWAALLVSGRKCIEVRKWSTSRRGRVLIHAARVPDERPEAWAWVTDDIRPLTTFAGGIIGEAELFDVRIYRDEPSFAAERALHLNEPSWFVTPRLYGFVFREPRVRPFRKFSGNVRFFTVEASVLE